LPKLAGVIETALYVDDLERARAFYEAVLGLVPLTSDSRFLAFDVGGRSVLLLFRRGSNCRSGKSGLVSTMLRSKAEPIGRAADAASISAIPTIICWNSLHRAFGRFIRKKMAQSDGFQSSETFTATISLLF